MQSLQDSQKQDPAALLYRPQDLARILGVTAGRIYQILQTESIATVRIGRSIFVRQTDWDRFLASKEGGGAKAIHIAEPIQDGEEVKTNEATD